MLLRPPIPGDQPIWNPAPMFASATRSFPSIDAASAESAECRRLPSVASGSEDTSDIMSWNAHVCAVGTRSAGSSPKIGRNAEPSEPTRKP